MGHFQKREINNCVGGKLLRLGNRSLEFFVVFVVAYNVKLYYHILKMKHFWEMLSLQDHAHKIPYSHRLGWQKDGLLRLNNTILGSFDSGFQIYRDTQISWFTKRSDLSLNNQIIIFSHLQFRDFKKIGELLLKQ